MRRKKYLKIWSILLLSILLIITWHLLFPLKLSISAGLNSFFRGLSSCADLELKLASLEAENVDLRARLLIETLSPPESIKVYSSYPFNNRSEIAIAAGADDDITKGNLIVQGQRTLVGKVREVAPKVSLVTTIFDPNFETAARIGESAVDALFKGGNELMLDLIPPDVILQEGSIVYTAGPDFPYGLVLGSLKKIEKSEGGVYQKASVEPAFEVRALRDVVLYP
jgi:cell shape-determining protein MreC